MSRISFFVDGFNVYHAINNPRLYKYKWLNYRKLCECFLKPQDTIGEIYFFTAFVPWSTPKILRHQTLIRALRNVGITPVLGAFRRINRTCQICKNDYITYEEKQTDVNIAIHVFRTAMENRYDEAIIISGDSDLIPSIHAVKESFTDKKIGVVIPIGGRAKELIQIADFHRKMKVKHLAMSQFSDSITLSNGKQLFRPKEWR